MPHLPVCQVQNEGASSQPCRCPTLFLCTCRWVPEQEGPSPAWSSPRAAGKGQHEHQEVVAWHSPSNSLWTFSGVQVRQVFFAFAFEGSFACGRGNTSSNRYFWSAVLSVGFRSTGPKELKSSLKRQPSCHWQGGPGTAFAGDKAAG